jgi:hypothetical protein
MQRSLVARLLWEQEAAGPKPAIPTMSIAGGRNYPNLTG